MELHSTINGDGIGFRLFLVRRFATGGGSTEIARNARSIRGSRRWDVPIERRGRDAEAVRYLGHGDVGIGEHRLGGLDIVIGEFRGASSSAAGAPRGGKARLGALPDQAALEFR